MFDINYLVLRGHSMMEAEKWPAEVAILNLIKTFQRKLRLWS